MQSATYQNEKVKVLEFGEGEKQGSVKIGWTNEDGDFWEKWVPQDEVTITHLATTL